MKKGLLLLFALNLSAVILFGQDLALYTKQVFIKNGDSLPYRILLPENYDASKKYPLVLFLHGSGERGNDNEKQLVHGSKLFLWEDVRKQFPAIVVFPQCSLAEYWTNMEIREDSNGNRLYSPAPGGEPSIAMKLTEDLIRKLIEDYGVHKKKIYVGGLSMGGMGTFEIVRRNPKLFAAAFPICGGADPSIAPRLKKVNWWVFHGAKDDAVHPENSIRVVQAMKASKVPVRFTLYPEANHNSWDPAFAEPELLPWLFSQKK